MKRCLLILAGAVSLMFTGCCCDWCNCCSPCGNSCASGCGPSYAGPPPGATYSSYSAPVVSAIPGTVTTTSLPATYAPQTATVVPLESLPTY